MTLNEKLTHDATQHGFSPILELTVAPAGAGKFTAWLDDRELCTSTKPFLAAARVLLAEGADPETVLQMRHEVSTVPAVRSTVGTAAGLMRSRSRPFGVAVPEQPTRNAANTAAPASAIRWASLGHAARARSSACRHRDPSISGSHRCIAREASPPKPHSWSRPHRPGVRETAHSAYASFPPRSPCSLRL
jgi:hypothetical protein